MEEAGGMPADTLVGIGPIADRWGDGLVWRMLEERGDAGTVPSRFILAHLGPRNKRVLLLSNVLKNGRPEVSTINEIRENEGSDVVGVVSVADMNRGASDYIAAETGVTAVRSAISAVGVFTSLRAVKRISPDYAAFGLRWAHNPRAPSVLSKDQVPFSTQTDLS